MHIMIGVYSAAFSPMQVFDLLKGLESLHED